MAGTKEEREAGPEPTPATLSSCSLTAQPQQDTGKVHFASGFQDATLSSILQKTGTPRWEADALGPIRRRIE